MDLDVQFLLWLFEWTISMFDKFEKPISTFPPSVGQSSHDFCETMQDYL